MSKDQPDLSAIGFHMPVVRCRILSADTSQAISRFLSAGYRDNQGRLIIGVRSDYYVCTDDIDHLIRDVSIGLHAADDAGEIYSVSTRTLPDTVLAGFKDLLFAFHQDDMVADNIASSDILPWKDLNLRHKMSGKFLSLHATRDFALLAREYMPSWVENRRLRLQGSHARIEERRGLCTMVLPKVSSAHEEVVERARWDEFDATARNYFAYLMEGMDYGVPFFRCDFDNIADLE